MPTSNTMFKERFESGIRIHGRLVSGLEFRCRVDQVHGDYIVTSDLKTVDPLKVGTQPELGDAQIMRMDAIAYFYKLEV